MIDENDLLYIQDLDVLLTAAEETELSFALDADARHGSVDAAESTV